MATRTIWVPIKGDGSDETPLRADVPDGIAWDASGGLPPVMDVLPNGRPPLATTDGLGGHMLITVDERDVARIPKVVAERDVHPELRLIVRMTRQLRCEREGGRVTDTAHAALDATFDDEAGQTATPEGRYRLRRALAYLVRRGVDGARAIAIARRIGLDLEAEVEDIA